MKKLILICITFLIFSTFGCAPKETTLPDCFLGGFVCEISFERDQTIYRLTLSRTDASGEDLFIEFHEPKALSGVRINKTDSKVTVSLWETSYSVPQNLRWLEIEKIFHIDGKIVDSRLEAVGGVSSNRLTIIGSDGITRMLSLTADGIPTKITASLFGRSTEAKILKYGRIKNEDIDGGILT